MKDIVALLDSYIDKAYSVNQMNSAINMLKNGNYGFSLKNTYVLMKEELPIKVKESHEASGAFLNAVYGLSYEEKEALAVLLLEKAAQCQAIIDELNYKLETVVNSIVEHNGVVPNLEDGVIPFVSANRNVEEDGLESEYMDIYQEKDQYEFAFNIYTNYATYLGVYRNKRTK